MSGTVSIIIPTYNRPQMLKRAILSVVQQSYSPTEILVVNDGGMEQEVRQAMSCCGNRAHYFTNECSKGGNGARNTGVKHAQGEYTAFLDDDDLWLPDKVSKQVDYLRTLDDSWGGVYCGYRVVERGRSVSFTNLPEGNFLSQFITGRSGIGSSSTLLFRTEAIRKIGMWDETLKRKQDVELMVRFFRFYKVGCVREPLVDIAGHNDPSGSVLEKTYRQYIAKVQAELDGLSPSSRQAFELMVAREIAYAYANDRQFLRLARPFWRAVQSKPIRIDKHLDMLITITLKLIGLGDWGTYVKRKMRSRFSMGFPLLTP